MTNTKKKTRKTRKSFFFDKYFSNKCNKRVFGQRLMLLNIFLRVFQHTLTNTKERHVNNVRVFFLTHIGQKNLTNVFSPMSHDIKYFLQVFKHTLTNLKERHVNHIRVYSDTYCP